MDTYAPFLRRLEGNYNVIAPDLPGHGFSDMPKLFDNDSVIDLLVELVVKVVGDMRIHVCGHSLGGYLAARVSLRINALSTLSFTPAGISIYNMSIVRILRFRLARMVGNYFW